MKNDDDGNDLYCDLKIINFELDTDNQHIHVCKRSKKDVVHAQYCLVIPNLTSFGSHMMRWNINKMNERNYQSLSKDKRFHNYIGTGDDDGY